MLPRVEAVQAELAEREETAAHLWHAYQGAHCKVKALELSIDQHLWPANSWPDGDESGIHCPTDAAPTPLFASTEEAATEREGPEAPAQERAAEAGRGGAAALVEASPDSGLGVSCFRGFSLSGHAGSCPPHDPPSVLGHAP